MTDWGNIEVGSKHILLVVSQVVNRAIEGHPTQLSETPRRVPLTESLEVTLK